MAGAASFRIAWLSNDAAEAFYARAKHRLHFEARRNGARNEFVLAAGEDVNRAARMS